MIATDRGDVQVLMVEQLQVIGVLSGGLLCEFGPLRGVRIGNGYKFHVRQLRQRIQQFADMTFQPQNAQANLAGKPNGCLLHRVGCTREKGSTGHHGAAAEIR